MNTFRDSQNATDLLSSTVRTRDTEDIHAEKEDFLQSGVFAWEFTDERYVVRLARDAAEIEAALRLRFEVFNLELGEGLESSYITGLDEDRFDAVCHHLIVIDREADAVIGTYRLQTLEMAGGKVENFYCAGEFRLEDLPLDFLRESLEIGRASIAREHRHTRVLFLLWKGLGAYLESSGKRFLFGCCSLTSQNAAEGWRAMRSLEKMNALDTNLWVAPQEEYACEPEDATVEAGEDSYQLPKLFSTYLRFGAKVCSPPAIDREFKTIDFFVAFDSAAIDEKIRRMFLV